MLQKVIRVASEIHTKNACKKRIKRITKTIAYKVSGVRPMRRGKGSLKSGIKYHGSLKGPILFFKAEFTQLIKRFF